MEPLGKMNAYFPVVNEQISKRNKKVSVYLLFISPHVEIPFFKALDYDAARSKLRKTIEKPGEDPTKLPKVSLTPAPCRSTVLNLHTRLNKNMTMQRRYSNS